MNGHDLTNDQARKGLFVSLAPNGFAVELPDPVTGASYPIVVPLTLKGLMVLQKILRERERETRRIGSDSSPVQQMVDAWLLEDRKRVQAAPLVEGLDLSSLEIDL